MYKRICKVCNKEFYVREYSQKRGFYCSMKCYGMSQKGKQRGKPFLKGQHYSPKTEFKKGYKQKKGINHYNWKGGRIIGDRGYILTYQPNHPFVNRVYVRESRLVVEKIIGRYLKPEEVVHHLGKKDDNRPKMLMAFINQSTHQKFERGGKVKPNEIIFDGRKFHY